MKNLVVGLIVGLVFGYALSAGAQQNLAVNMPCARWISGFASSGESEVSRVAFRVGYSIAILALTDHEMFTTRPRETSYLTNSNELVTAISARCNTEPQRRLVDVVLSLLGF